MSQIRIESAGRFGTAFHKALDEKGMDLVEFSRAIDANYEHQRKIFKGLMLPSPRLLDAMCKKLSLKKKDMEVLIAQDRMEKKVGKVAFNAAIGRSPYASDFDALLPHLSEMQIEQILAQMKLMVKQNTQHAKTAR